MIPRCAPSISRITIIRAAVFLVLLSVPSNAVQCSDIAHNAVKNATEVGTSWLCCSAKYGYCIPSETVGNDCSGIPGPIAQCIRVAAVAACGVGAYSSLADGGPCGEFRGTPAQAFVQLVRGAATAPLPIDMVARHVVTDWTGLAYENALSLCCSVAKCRMVPLEFINVNACRNDEFEVKCAGTASLGLCSTWIGAEDGGQYFLVNAQAPVPALSLSAGGYTETSAPASATSSTASITHSAASTTDLPPTDSNTSATPSSSPLSIPAPTTASRSSRIPIADLPPTDSNTFATPTSSLSSFPTPTTTSRDSGIPGWAIAFIVLLCSVPVAAVLVILFRRFRPASSRTWRYRQINAYPTAAQLPAEGLIDRYAPPNAPPPKYAEILRALSLR